MKLEYLNKEKLTNDLIGNLNKLFEYNGYDLSGYEYEVLKMTIENTVNIIGDEFNESIKVFNYKYCID